MKSSVKLAAASIAVALCSGAWAAPGTQGEAKPKAAARSASSAPAKAVKKPVAKAKAKKPTPTAGAKKPATSAKAPAPRKPTVAAKVPAAVPAREPHWTQLPPSRFYPNGIPALRPEFLHPLPSEVPVVAAPPPPRTYEVPGHIEMMP